MKALVTGGAGFIGSHVAARLAQDGHEVATYDVNPGRGVLGCEAIIGNLHDEDALKDAMRGQDMVFHLAGNADIRGGADHPNRDLMANFIGTRNVLDAMRTTGVKRLMFASSSAVYGQPAVIPTPEDCPFPVQRSLYGASKVAAEALISAYCHSFGMHADIFRFALVIGEGYRHGHIYDFWRKLQADPTRIEVLGNGEQRKSLIYVGDVVEGIMAGICEDDDGYDPPVHIYNVGGYQATTINQSLDVICEVLGVNPERSYTDMTWAGDAPVLLLDCASLHTLGWRPQVSTAEAILRTVRSFS